jgi:uncharacterized peroxidase-related enzyme
VVYLKSLPEDGVLLDVFKAKPETARPLIAYHELVMRGPSPLSVGERELIAAYVSGVNSCGYCHGIHTKTAEAFGIAPGLLEAALADLDSSPVDDKLRPLLRYVGKLTAAPSKMVPADAEAVYAAGWDDTALYDAILVCALFNFMNRVVDGIGIRADESYYRTSGNRLAETGYSGLERFLDE